MRGKLTYQNFVGAISNFLKDHSFQSLEDLARMFQLVCYYFDHM